MKNSFHKQMNVLMMYFLELLTCVVNVVLDPVQTHLDIEYISKAKECFNDVIFRVTEQPLLVSYSIRGFTPQH